MATVTVKIFNEHGLFIKDLISSAAQYPGAQSIYWDGKDSLNNVCANGIYFFKIIAVNNMETLEKFGECCIYNF